MLVFINDLSVLSQSLVSVDLTASFSLHLLTFPRWLCIVSQKKFGVVLGLRGWMEHSFHADISTLTHMHPPTIRSLQSSGVGVSDEVVSLFEEMKIRHTTRFFIAT